MSLRPGSEFASDPNLEIGETVEERFPNRFLFIGDTFYFDDRKVNSDHVANQVKDWVEDHQISVPKPLNLSPISEADILIEDLKPILGFPYLFQHANDCEHLIVFMDIRFL